jgi:uncharacterized protein YbcI
VDTYRDYFGGIGRRLRNFRVSLLRAAARPSEKETQEAVRVASQDGEPTRGQSAQAISQAVVRLMREYTGRGPTQAHTTINDNVVIVVLRDTLMKAEHSLVGDGEAHAVMEMRRRFQGTMRDDLVAAVERQSGRTVDAFLSDNIVEPDVAVEVFILKPREDDRRPVAAVR